jgi:hypothetical protein
MNSTVFVVWALSLGLGIYFAINPDQYSFIVAQQIFTFLGVMITMAIFVDSLRRMKIVFAQIDILKRSERVFFSVIAIYLVYFLTQLGIVISSRGRKKFTTDPSFDKLKYIAGQSC